MFFSSAPGWLFQNATRTQHMSNNTRLADRNTAILETILRMVSTANILCMIPLLVLLLVLIVPLPTPYSLLPSF